MLRALGQAGAVGFARSLYAALAVVSLLAGVLAFGKDVHARAVPVLSPAHQAQWRQVPPAARGPISTVLGAADPAYRVRGSSGTLTAVSHARG